MPYILNKTNGAVLATVQDASVDLTTNLTFVGRNYSGYGEIVNENLVKLLENFSSNSIGLHLTSQKYSADDYIKDFETLKKQS
jgi:hypothetical protein